MRHHSLLASSFLLIGCFCLPVCAFKAFSGLPSDPRAGLWEATILHKGLPEHFSLQLEIVRWTRMGGSLHEVVSGLLSMGAQAGVNCPFNSQDASNSLNLKLACLAQVKSKFVPDGRWLYASFAKDGKAATVVLKEQSRSLTLHFRRPPQEPDNSPLVGNWIADGSGQTCVLHVYARDQPDPVRDLLDPLKLAVSLDVFESKEGDYGKAIYGIDYRPQDGDAVSFSWQDTGTSMFTGHLDRSRGKIIGAWPGGDCDVFSRFTPRSK